MKIDDELTKKLLIGGMVIIFILIAASYTFDKDNIKLFVNGDEVGKDIITIGSIASTADKYEFDPGEKMEISMDVTNDRNVEYDFKVKVWEEKTLGSEEIIVFESDPVTIEKDRSFTFSTEYTVPLEPGIYFISTLSYYAPVGHMNFARYDDGTYFTITVLDNPPVIYNDTEEPTETPTATGTETGTPTPTATGTPSLDVTDDDESIFDFVDLEDEYTKIFIGIFAVLFVLIVGYFALRNWIE